MATYVLSYTLLTNIKQGGHDVYADEEEKSVEFECADLEAALLRASTHEQEILFKHKQPNAAVHWEGLCQKIDWKPQKEIVRF